CPALDPVDSLAYAALHALRSLFVGGLTPQHMYDIAWFLHTNAENDAFWEKRCELHHQSLRSLEAVCFRLAHEWFGCRLPEEVEHETRSLPAKVQLWFENYALSPLTWVLHPNKDALWLHLGLLEAASDRRAILYRGLLPAPPQPSERTSRSTLRTV